MSIYMSIPARNIFPRDRRSTHMSSSALAMSNSLSTLDLSELPEPYLRPPTSSAASPHPQPYLSTASTNSRSTPHTSALNYSAYPPVTPTALDVWIAASQTQHEIQPGQPARPGQPGQPAQPAPPGERAQLEAHDTPEIPLFSSFLQPTAHAKLPETPADPALDAPSLQVERPLPPSHLSPPHSIPRRTRAAPPFSHAFSQSDRMIYTTPLRHAVPPQTAPLPTAVPPDTAPLATPVITPMFSTTSDGLSAVERAKKTADQFTMSQLAKKRKAAGLDPDPKRARNGSSSKSSSDDDDRHHENRPEKISHRKYQKRLQKNRDSAFVSRIRRREYTRLLEESLASTEKEKDSAVNSFLEMKRRFDIVSAELNAFKQAAASNLSAVRDSLFRHLSTTTTDTQPARSGSAVTSMFMITLMFGILLPDCIRQQFGLQRYSADSHLPAHGAAPGAGAAQQSGFRSMLFGIPFSQASHRVNESRGKVWGKPAGPVPLEELGDTDNSCLEDILQTIRSCSFDLLGAQHSDSFLRLAEPYLEGLSSMQMARLGDVFRHGNSTRFQQLVEIEALARRVGQQRPSESESLLEHVTLQLENARL